VNTGMHHSAGSFGVPADQRPGETIPALAMLRDRAAGVREFYNFMRPAPTDSTEVRVAKNAFRWSSAVAGAAAVAVMVL